MAHRTIPAVIESEPEVFDPSKRHWKLSLYGEDGTPYSPEGSGGVYEFEDDFSTNQLANAAVYPVVTNLAVDTGKIKAATNAVTNLQHVASLEDQGADVEINPYAVGEQVGLVLKALDANNFLYAQAHLQSGNLRIQLYTFDAGAPTNLIDFAAGAHPVTPCWLRAEIVGDIFGLAVFDVHPDLSFSKPMALRNVKLAGAAAAKFGAGVEGRAGFRTGGGLTWRVDRFRIWAP